jgi:hypothetical protein
MEFMFLSCLFGVCLVLSACSMSPVKQSEYDPEFKSHLDNQQELRREHRSRTDIF